MTETGFLRKHHTEIRRMAAFASRRYRMESDVDDLAQEGEIALVKALRKGAVCWETYGRHVVFNAMKMYARSQWGKVCDELDDNAESHSPGPVEVRDFRDTVDLLRQLPRREQIVLMRLALGDSHVEVGHALGLTAQRVGKVATTARKRLEAVAV